MGFEYGQYFQLECPDAFLIAPAPPANSQFPETVALKTNHPHAKYAVYGHIVRQNAYSEAQQIWQQLQI